MAFVINDRVKETSNTTGTGAFTLNGALVGFDTFAAGIGGNNTTYYAIFNQNTGVSEFEVGLGTLDATGNILTRTSIFTSSNSDTVVNFSSGIKDVFVTLPASKAILLNDSNTVDINGNIDVDGGTIKLDGNYPVGSNNVALGDGALDDGSLSGGSNVAIGTQSLTSNTTGEQNIAIGYNALSCVASGIQNVAVGSRALEKNTASNNVSVGKSSLQDNTTGTSNTALGTCSLCANTTASNNTAVGLCSLKSNTTGCNNVAVGSLALDANTKVIVMLQ
jgi:trimeric autotransporter adhesin